jgi:hypothetical protein
MCIERIEEQKLHPREVGSFKMNSEDYIKFGSSDSEGIIYFTCCKIWKTIVWKHRLWLGQNPEDQTCSKIILCHKEPHTKVHMWTYIRIHI